MSIVLIHRRIRRNNTFATNVDPIRPVTSQTSNVMKRAVEPWMDVQRMQERARLDAGWTSVWSSPSAKRIFRFDVLPFFACYEVSGFPAFWSGGFGGIQVPLGCVDSVIFMFIPIKRFYRGLWPYTRSTFALISEMCWKTNIHRDGSCHIFVNTVFRH